MKSAKVCSERCNVMTRAKLDNMPSIHYTISAEYYTNATVLLPCM